MEDGNVQVHNRNQLLSRFGDLSHVQICSCCLQSDYLWSHKSDEFLCGLALSGFGGCTHNGPACECFLARNCLFKSSDETFKS